LAATWNLDRRALLDAGYEIEVVRERPAFVEAIVRRGAESVILQWTHDSAFRFFPLVEHPELGLTLHPFDLATNKVLALVGRVEARNWIDILRCDSAVQPLGYLAWAATGKDPGLAPDAILHRRGAPPTALFLGHRRRRLATSSTSSRHAPLGWRARWPDSSTPSMKRSRFLRHYSIEGA